MSDPPPPLLPTPPVFREVHGKMGSLNWLSSPDFVAPGEDPSLLGLLGVPFGWLVPDEATALFGLLGLMAFAAYLQHRGYRAWLVIAVAGAGLYSPFLLPRGAPGKSNMMRSLLSFCSTFYFTRVYDLARRPAAFAVEPLLRKMAHIFMTFHSVHLVKPHPRGKHFNAPVFYRLLFDAAVCYASVLVVRARDRGGPLAAPVGYAQGVVAGGVLVVGSLNAFGHVLQFLCLLLGGMEVPDLMRQPERATSLGEFWARRWNTVIQASLANVFTGVVAVCGQGAGARFLALVMTFTASGIWHTYPVVVGGLSWGEALSMMSYFWLQAALVLLERLVSMHAVSAALAHPMVAIAAGARFVGTCGCCRGGARRRSPEGRAGAAAVTAGAQAGAEGVVSAKKPTAQVMRGAKEKRRLQASANTWAVYLVRLWTLSMVLLPAPLILGPAFTLCGDPLWPSAMPVSPV